MRKDYTSRRKQFQGGYGIVSYLDTPEELPVLMLSDKSWKKSWLRMQEMRQSRWMSIFSFRKIL